MKPMLQDSDSYQVDVACKNCHYTGSLSFPKGTRAETESYVGSNYVNETCPNCGCHTLVKVWPIMG